MFTSASQQAISLMSLGLAMTLGAAYIAIGIYGYNYAVQKPDPLIHLLYFVVQIPLGGMIVYLSHGAGFNALIMLPLVGHSVILLSRKNELAANTAVILVYGFAVRMYSPGWEGVWPELPTFLAGVVFILVFTQMAVTEERSRGEVEHLVDELGEANQRLREYAAQVEELAITKERNRLAREIHDGLGHYLTAIHMQIQAARALMENPDPRADQALTTAQSLAKDALDDVRQSVASLRASPVEGSPLEDAIQKLLNECNLDQVEAHFQVSGSPRSLPPQVHLTLYRTAQESLNNIRKHANAQHVEMVLDYTDPAWITLSVQDDGEGTDHFQGGFGLLGLQERANLLGGRVQMLSQTGQGFHLELVVPA